MDCGSGGRVRNGVGWPVDWHVGQFDYINAERGREREGGRHWTALWISRTILCGNKGHGQSEGEEAAGLRCSERMNSCTEAVRVTLLAPILEWWRCSTGRPSVSTLSVANRWIIKFPMMFCSTPPTNGTGRLCARFIVCTAVAEDCCSSTSG